MENHLIKQFIWEDDAILLGKEFMQFARYFRLPGDRFYDEEYKYCLANYKPALDILCDKTPLINKLTGTMCYPTYAFMREYTHRNVLPPHKDRAECEISISCHLWGDQPWDLSVNGQNYSLKPGDAVLYYGCDQEHSREPYQGQHYVSMFLHWVDSKGEFADKYFSNQLVTNPKHGKFINRYNKGAWRNVVTET